MNNQSLTSRISVFLAFSLLSIISISLIGCSSSNSVTNADPTGYYDITGTAMVKEDNDTVDLLIDDLQAMVHNNRIMMISMANGLVYDGIMAVSGNTFTATVTVYRNQVTLHSNVTINGNITEGSSISGTLTGTGAGNGTFSLTYATANNQVATLARVESFLWTGIISGDNFSSRYEVASGNVIHDGFPRVGALSYCEMNGTILPVSNTSLYVANVTLTNCTDTTANADYTGLATLRDVISTDDTLVFSVTNGIFSLNGEFDRM